MKTARSLECRNQAQINRAKSRKSSPASQFVINPAKSKRGPGNPHWGKTGGAIPNEPTEFDKLVAKLEIPQDLWPVSAPLRLFAKKFGATKYVPEYLLEHWGFRIDDEAVSITNGSVGRSLRARDPLP